MRFLRTDYPLSSGTVKLDGDDDLLEVKIAGFTYRFRVTDRSDAAFTLTEVSPQGDELVIAQGSEQ